MNGWLLAFLAGILAQLCVITYYIAVEGVVVR
jgi:hypothetical protein